MSIIGQRRHVVRAVMEDLAVSQRLDPVFTTSRTLSFMLQPCPSDWIEAYEVSTLVNNPANDSPACI
jgi:putative SOS response-associated peptidase YedK